jgi:hypothetical protein
MAVKPSTPDTEPQADAVVEAPAVSDAPVIDLDEFCARLSERVRKIPLISGFAADCRKNGHLRDTEASYRVAFDAFRTRSA